MKVTMIVVGVILVGIAILDFADGSKGVHILLQVVTICSGIILLIRARI